MPQKNIIDSVTMASPREVAKSAFLMIDRIQSQQPGVQVQAIAALALLLMEEFGVNVRQELERAGRIMHDADKQLLVEFEVVRDYIRGELKA